MSPDGQEQGEGLREVEEEGRRGGPGVGTLGPGVKAGIGTWPGLSWNRQTLEAHVPRGGGGPSVAQPDLETEAGARVQG